MKTQSLRPKVDARAKRIAARVIAVAVGLGLAFFLVLAPLFTDGPRSLADPERLASLALTVLVYLAVAVVLGFLAPRDPRLAFWLAAPGVVLGFAYAATETGILPLAVAYAAGAVAGSLAGVFVAGLRRRGD